MNKFDDLIREAMEPIEQEPPEGHLNRFMQKMKQEEAHRNMRRIRPWLAAAAAVAFFAVGWWFFEFTGAVPRSSTGLLAGLPADFIEAEDYYNHLLQKRIQEIKTLYSGKLDWNSGFLAGIDEMMKVDESAHEELMADPGNEMIEHAIIQQYQTRINILNKLIEQINPSGKQLNPKAYENPNSTF